MTAADKLKLSGFLKQPTSSLDDLLAGAEKLKDNSRISIRALKKDLGFCKWFYDGIDEKIMPLLKSNDFIKHLFFEKIVTDPNKLNDVTNYLSQFSNLPVEEQNEKLKLYPPVNNLHSMFSNMQFEFIKDLRGFEIKRKGLNTLFFVVLFVFGIVVDVALDKLVKLFNLDAWLIKYMSAGAIEYIKTGITVLIVMLLVHKIEDWLADSIEKRKFNSNLQDFKTISQNFNKTYDECLQEQGLDRDKLADAMLTYL